ncbi:MAG: hypothetical protein E7028_01160 [Planctomycetaceae bacterium]|nr:hypothetical protein [Planctomycetaceae bacterium]MBQ2821308.1 hypothetical protein [Thermoguttaceae bacterium]MDO4426035.1 hypothetical protein [Planctomycetia bacterium]
MNTAYGFQPEKQAECRKTLKTHRVQPLSGIGANEKDYPEKRNDTHQENRLFQSARLGEKPMNIFANR